MSNPDQLDRFLDAQAGDYAAALREIQAGQKRTHWMWYIFPQLRGLGFSQMAQRYAIQSLDEARAYLSHPVLGLRLREIAEAALMHKLRSAREIFGTPDDLKLRSCATLFSQIAEPGSPFHRLLAHFFVGEEDPETLRLLGRGTEPLA